MPVASARPQPTLTRRQGLTAAALLGPLGLIAACTTQEAAPTDETAAASASAATAGLAGEVAEQERRLVAQYDAAISAFPALSRTLGDIRDQHVQHAAALDASATATAVPVAAPAGQAAALGALIAAEREAMRSRIESCVAAQDAGLARTLAFIAASEGSHVPALRDLRA